MHFPVLSYIFRIIRVALVFLDGCGLQNPCAYLLASRWEIFTVRFAVSLFSLDTLDISVKYEIYESKIFTNNTARYPPDMPFSIKKNGPMVVIVHADLEREFGKKFLCFRNYIREVNRNHKRKKERAGEFCCVSILFSGGFLTMRNAVRIDGRVPVVTCI